MIKTLLFVHGTGVRKASFEKTFAVVVSSLKKKPQLRDLAIEPCLWGDAFGARLGLKGASIPEYSGDLAAAKPDEEHELALWQLLDRDPLFELRELAAAAAQRLQPPAEKQRKSTYLQALRALADDAQLLPQLEGLALRVQWQQSVAAVIDNGAFAAALAAQPLEAALRGAVARALVAQLQQQLEDDNMPQLAKPTRNAIVEAIVDRTGGHGLGRVADWFKARAVRLIASWGTAKARRERDSISNAAYPLAGDILLYQTRGRQVRDFIARRIAECGDNVAVLAHSLGGIASVDMLIARQLPQVKLLMTVGSQAPLLYEMNALSRLRFGRELPAHFPRRWLNVYDCNDLLSYRAAPVFAGRAEDLEVSSGQPFPLAHSAYWDLDALWQRVGAELTRA